MEIESREPSGLYFTEPLTMDEVLAAMRSSVDDYGRDWVDPNANTTDGCKYVYGGSVAPHGGPARCLIGEIIWRLRGVQLPPGAEAIHNTMIIIDANEDPPGPRTEPAVPVASRAAAGALSRAQGLQDIDSTWGEVLDNLTSSEANV